MPQHAKRLRQPAAHDAAPQAAPQAAPPDERTSDVLQPPATAEPLSIRKVFSSEWTDAEEKLAGRRRVRIVDADFKYPMLRLEETVATDPKTGEEKASLIRASVADHVIVGLVPGTDIAKARTLLEESGYRIRSVEPDSFLLAELADPVAPDAQPDAIREIGGLDEFIRFAEPDYIVFPSLAPNDPDYSSGKMWGFENRGNEAGSVPDADIDAPEAWEVRNDASSVVVAVTDTGIQYNHEDLRDNMWSAPETGVHGFDAYDNDSDPMDTGGHGTHCAGTIGARGNNSIGTAGVAWRVQLMAVRFLGPNGGTTSDGVRAINYARLNGANIINASWGGGGYSQSLYDAINACRESDIPFVAAAGNDGANNDSVPHYPSSYDLPNVVAVASTTKEDLLSAFSCYGKNSVDISAPGSSIWSTYVGGNNAYKFLNGTSMATPHVSGALALAKAQFPGESYSELIGRLDSSADKSNVLLHQTSTGGRLNIDHLIRGVLPPKAHDNFADALRFENGYGSWSGTSTGATREPDEDAFSVAGLGQYSLWFAFNSGEGGLVSLDSLSNLTGYKMVAFEGGAKGSLKPIASAGALTDTRGQIRFNAKPDTEYRVVLDSHTTLGRIYFLSFQQAPGNDFFTSGKSVGLSPFHVLGTNRGATQELFEQASPHAGSGQGRSVWWRWVAPKDEDFTISTSGSDYDTVMAVYTGANASSLVPVAANDDRSPLDYTSQVTFRAIAGTTYHIAVDSFRVGSAGNIALHGFRSGTLAILRQPVGLSAESGRRAVFDISVISDSEVSYQWFFNGSAIPGQTAANLVIDPLRNSNFGNYRVEARNSESIAVSDTVVLAELQSPPRLAWFSGNQSVASGTPISLSADFFGTRPMTFSWTKNGVAFPSGSSSLAFPSPQTTDSGTFQVTATNSAGSAAATIQLNVIESPWERWEWRRPGITNASITDIKVYDNEAFAVSGTLIMRSADGKTWLKSVFPNGFIGNSLAKAGSKFVCFGTDQVGAFRIATSTDNAVTWAINTITGFPVSSQPEKCSVMGYGSAFIAWSPSGRDFIRSTNGTSWTRLTATNFANLSVNLMGNGSVATNGSTLILASMSNGGNSGTSYFRSTDGIAWKEYATQGEGSGSGQTACYAMGKFHLIGGNSIHNSSDGVNWDYHYAPSNTFSSASLLANNGTTVFAFQPDSQTLRYYDDPDVRKSRALQPAGSHSFTAAASFGAKVIYGTDRGLLGLAADPLDVAIPLEVSTTLSSVEFTEDLFIARSTNPSYLTTEAPNYVSGDGVTWKQSTKLDSPNVAAAGSAFGKYYGTRSFEDYIYAGFNPFDLRKGKMEGTGFAPTVTFIGQLPDGSALAVNTPVSGAPTLKTRASGSPSWATATFPLFISSGSKFASLGNRWYSNVASTSSAVIYTSASGSSWTSTGMTGSNPHFVTFGGKSWCFYQGTSAPIRAAYSTNGTSWTSQNTSGLPSALSVAHVKRVVVFGEYLVLLGKDESLYYSQDGIAWLRGSTPGKVADVSSGKGQLVALMKNGGIIQTGTPHPGRNAPLVSILSPQTTSTHLIGSRITVEGTTSDPEDGPANYECYLDAQLVASGSGNAFRFQVTPTDPSGHTVTVRVTDSQGLHQIDSIRLRVVAAEPDNLLTNVQGSPPPQHSLAVSFDGVFYTAGARSLHRSLDGRSWEKVPIPGFSNTIYGMASGNGSLVIQFDNGAIMTTRDGVNWTHYSPNLTDYWVREPIRFSAGVFIAAYHYPGQVIGSVMSSPDGLRWEVGVISMEGYLAWSANGSDGSIIGANGYRNGVNITHDRGFNWFPILPLAGASAYNSHGIFADGKYVVAITGSNKVYVSGNNLAWVGNPMPPGINGQPALGHVGGLVFLGQSPDFSHVSPNGSTWQPMSLSVNRSHITSLRGIFVAQAKTGGIVTSRDGVSWTPVSIPGLNPSISQVVSTEALFLVIDSTGGIWSSPDGATWQALPRGGVAPQYSSRLGYNVASLDGRIVAAGNGLLVTSSDDGRSWVSATVNDQPSSVSSVFHKVVSSPSAMLVSEGSYSSASTLLRSTTGTSFNTISGLPAKIWADFSTNGSEWMLLAEDGAIFRSSTGGATWSQLSDASVKRGAAVEWFNGRWIFIGASDSVSNSPYVGFTLEAGDSLQNRGTIGFYNSSSAVKTLVHHGKMIIWQRGEGAFITSDGVAWATTNLNAGGGNKDYDIYHTPDGFRAFVGSTLAYDPVTTWEAGFDGWNWQTVGSAFNSIQYAANLGDRVFLFAAGVISELRDKDLALSISSLPTAIFGVGDKISANVTVTNYGRAITASSKWRVTAWLAKNRFYGDTKNVLIGTFDLVDPMPAAGASSVHDVSFTLPNRVLTGDNYLILSLSSLDGILESNRANNTVISDDAAVNIPEWEFSVVTNGNGQVNRDFAASRYPHKSQLSLTASAGKGATFTGWAGDALSPENQITLLMDGNKSVQANFASNAVLQLFVRGVGKVTGLADLGSYPVGATAALTAEPSQGWVFSHWSGASSDATPSTSVLMDSPKVLTAHFVRSFSDWKHSVFSAEQLADAAVSGKDSDPDGDGLRNWQEHLHGSNPLDRASTGVAVLTLDGDFLRCVFTRLSSPASGTPILCEAGRDLSDWNAPELEERVIATVDGIETIEARLPHGTSPRGFIRFRYVPETP